MAIIKIPKHIKGLIFDCDGLLVDSEPLSCKALKVVLEQYYNVDIGKDFSAVIGTSLKQTIFYYANKYDFKISNLDDLMKDKDQIYQMLAKGKLKPFVGVDNFLENVKKNNFRVAVASSGSLEKISFNLIETNLIQHFNIITSSEEVIKGKPEPDLFLRTAKKMNLNPKHILVFEDSLSGIKAAQNSKMMVIGITNTFSRQKLEQIGPDYVIDSISEISIE